MPRFPTAFPTPLNSTCKLLQGDGSGYAIIAVCTGAAPTTADVFQIGCQMTRTDTGAIFVNTGTVASPVWTTLNTGVEAQNYIVATGGSANTLVGSLTNGSGASVTVETGLMVALQTNQTLQAGANTFDLNGSGAKSITKQSKPGLNLTTTFSAGAVLQLVYSGGVWQTIGY